MSNVIKIKRNGRTDDRHLVLVETGHIDLCADDACAGLFADGSPYFQRGDTLVRKVQGPDAAKHRPGSDAPLLVTASPAMLLDDLERTCRFLSRKENPETGEVRTKPIHCPKALPAVIQGRAGRLPVPAIRGLAEVPQLYADGTIVADGYDARAKVLVIAPGDWPRVAAAPTEADARAALARFDGLLAGFPFASVLDRSVSLAAFLSAVLRPTLPSCPAFAWSAPVRGSGKSKLADVAAVLATGRTSPALTWARQEEEAEKRLAAAVMAGDPVLLLDNIESALRGACLNSLLTQPTVALRILGRSQLLRVSAAVLVLATGNNLTLLGDLSRRFLVANLDPEMERPELRRFDFDPVERALAERGELVAALHTIARWGQDKTTGLPPLGSFEVWSRRVRDPLVALGLPDPCAVLDRLHQADPEREDALELLTEWHRSFDSQATTVAEAIRLATRLKDPDTILRDALDAVAGGPGGLSPKRLGRYLLRIRDRVVGGLVLRQGRDLVGNVANWSVESVPGYRVTGFPTTGERKKVESAEGSNADPCKPTTRNSPNADGSVIWDGGAP